MAKSRVNTPFDSDNLYFITSGIVASPAPALFTIIHYPRRLGRDKCVTLLPFQREPMSSIFGRAALVSAALDVFAFPFKPNV